MSEILKIWQSSLDECEAMIDYALASGMQVPAELLGLYQGISAADSHEPADISAENMENLARLHNQLANIVKPARPRSLLLIRHELDKKSIFLPFGRVPFIRNMMLVALLSLLGLIAIASSSDINDTTISLSILNNSGGSLWRVQLLFLFAAALGASFHALYRANQYIVEGSFDPKYESSYWVRFVVGLISGIILTQLLPNETLVQTAQNAASGEPDSPAHSDISGLARVTLALVGGFSANLVYLILSRIIESLQYLIEPPDKARQETAAMHMTNQFEAQQLQTRAKVMNETLALKQKLMAPENQNPQKVQEIMDRHIKQVSGDTGDDTSK